MRVDFKKLDRHPLRVCALFYLRIILIVTLTFPPNYLLSVPQAQAQVVPDPLTQGLVGHWKFDEASGTTAADASGNAYARSEEHTSELQSQR